MEIKLSERLMALESYPFAMMDERIRKMREEGVDVIDFGVGSPKLGVPEIVRERLKDGIEEFKFFGYPTYDGTKEFRKAAAGYLKRRFGIEVEPEKEVLICAGTKELLFHLPEAFINPGDYALVTTPGFAPSWRGVLFAEGKYFLLPINEENDYLPDLDKVTKDILKKAKYVAVNYPNNPTGRIASAEFYKRLLKFAEKNNLFVVSDEAYIELYFGERPTSMLALKKEGVLAFFSLSKQSAMANYRIGFAAGDERIIGALKKLKSNIDSGVANAIQYAAVAALSDDDGIDRMRKRWKRLIEIIVEALSKTGLDVRMPEGTFYIWQKVPKGYDSVSFAFEMLERCGIGVMPGNWLCAPGDESGKNYIRIAVNEQEEVIEKAAKRISSVKW